MLLDVNKEWFTRDALFCFIRIVEAVLVSCNSCKRDGSELDSHLEEYF